MKKVLTFLTVLLLAGCGNEVIDNIDDNQIDPEPIIEKKVSIINLDSNTRPYAVTINNYPSAVKVQSGLDKAFLIYEFPVEYGLTRSLALYKDIEDVKIGTIRSSRHNFIDYALENDALYVHYGWSHYAKDDELNGIIDYIDGNSSDPAPFYREEHENLAWEHRVYTNLSSVIDYIKNNKNYRLTTDKKPLLNYSVDNIDLSSKTDSIKASNVYLKYSSSYDVKFVYNEEDNRYYRYVNGKEHTDYFTKEHYSTKNIIVVKLDWEVKYDNYLAFYNTNTTGSGYYITNGYAIPIKWKKDSRTDQTIYMDMNSNPINVNDGNTYIMLFGNSKEMNIN